MLLDLLHNQIDITQAPFSDRGSRLLIFKEQTDSRLFLKLAERLLELDPAPEAYVHRPPFIRDLVLLGPNEDALDFELETSPDLLTFNTVIGKFQLVFQDETALAFGLPANVTSGIRFEVQAEHYQVRTPGGWTQPVRIVSYSTNGVLVKNETAPTADGYAVDLLVRAEGDCTLELRISDAVGTKNGLLPFSTIRAAARARWQGWFERVPSVAERYRRTYAYAWWVIANNLVSPQGQIKFEAAMPSKAKYIGLWLWDCALHALALRHVDAVLARDQIRAFLVHQLPDGMLPDAIFNEGVVAEIDHPLRGRVTKPPILAWAALKIHQSAPALAFLREIYAPLARWNDWWFEQSKDGREGLAQYNHPYSSGLDDSPLWDEGVPVISPDLNTYLYIQMNALSQIARALGLEMEAAVWEERSAHLLQRMIQGLWDEQAGIFHALHVGKPVPVMTPFNLYPLWTGTLPSEIVRRLMEHLLNPDEFWGDLALPTVARNDPKYEPGTMWRGPIWANINYFFIEALELVGQVEAAIELREKTLTMLMKARGVYEYYHAGTGLPPESAAPMFGWSAAVFIELAIQASSLKNVDN